MDTKTCSMCNIEKISRKITKDIQNAKNEIAQEEWNVTRKANIKFQTDKNYTMKKKEMEYYYRERTIDV